MIVRYRAIAVLSVILASLFIGKFVLVSLLNLNHLVFLIKLEISHHWAWTVYYFDNSGFALITKYLFDALSRCCQDISKYPIQRIRIFRNKCIFFSKWLQHIVFLCNCVYQLQPICNQTRPITPQSAYRLRVSLK